MSKTDEMVPPGPGPEAAGPARIDERYRIDKEIGRGGMGRVFVAHDRKLGRDVAIKVLASGLHGEEALRRFEQEARATCALSHANILDVHDIGTHDGSPYIVSELLHGSTLRERLQQGALPPAEATGYALQLAKGLSAAHDKGIIHRDLKPENLFITNEGQLKILDFGIAKLLAPTASESAETPASPRPHTATGAIVGTVGYMSPEQVRGRPVDGRSDLFSFGAIFHEMLCGCSPFERDTAVETGYAVLSADPPELPAEVPAALKRIVQRCLEKEPARRFQSATDLVVALTATSGAPAEKSRWRWAAVVIVLVAVAAAGWFLWHESRIRWAREKVLPEIAQLVEQGRSRAAFALAEQIERIIPADPMLARLFKEMSVSLSIETSPDGADVFVADYDSSAFRHLGRAPVSVRLDDAFHRWRVTKDGFATVEAITSNGRVSGDIPFLSRKLKFVLDKELPPGMVRVPGGPVPLLVPGYDRLPRIEMPDYFIDRYEVTNRQFKQFVDQGGYSRRELWKEPFTDGGRTLAFEEAVARFRDRTGRPGPSTWMSGDHPEGQDEFPVTGVSWFEAAAYAAFAGKSLPTVYHWNHAAGMWASALIIPASNFGEAGPARVGSHRDLDAYGAQDMAGNAKEWCWNPSGGKRYILGAAWNEPPHMFNELDAQSPFDRGARNGFRLVKYLDEAEVPATVKGPLPDIHTRDYAKEKPVADAIFEVYRSLYGYDRTELKASIEAVEDSSDRFRREKVGFAATYGNERIFAYLYTPKNVRPPWQVVLFFPGAAVTRLRSIEELPPSYLLSFILKSGRAVALPVFKSTFERGDALKMTDQEPTRFYRDHVIEWSNDLGRTLDYLETRAEFDRHAIAFYGASWGAKLGPIMLATEPRLRAAVLVGGGLNLVGAFPEVDPFNFAPHVKQPVLMINGRFDFQFPVSTSQEAVFRVLGTPDKDKRHIVFESGHHPPNDLTMKETLDWFDRYLGPVR